MNHLAALYPAAGLIVVGAGSDISKEPYAGWATAIALLVEADASLSSRLEESIRARRGWTVRHALVGPDTTEQAFFVASIPRESGLVPPEALSPFWKNLATRERVVRDSTTVDKLAADAFDDPATLNWLIVDCLPAISVLAGAHTTLEQCDVVVARVIISNDLPADVGAGKAAVDELLAKAHFKCVAVEEERHPAFALAFYVRDWKSMFASAGVSAAAGADAIAEADNALHAHETSLAANAELQASVASLQRSLADISQRSEEQARKFESVIAELSDTAAQTARQLIFQADEHARVTRQYDEQALIQSLELAEHKAALVRAAEERVQRERAVEARIAEASEISRISREQEATLLAKQEQIDRLERACQDLLSQASKRHTELQQAVAEAGDRASLVDYLKSWLDDIAPNAAALHSTGNGFQSLSESLKFRMHQLAQERTAWLAAGAEKDEIVKQQDERIQALATDQSEHARVSTERLAHIERLQAEIISHLQNIQRLEASQTALSEQIAAQSEELHRAHAEKSALQLSLAGQEAAVAQLQNTAAQDRSQMLERLAQVDEVQKNHDEHARVSSERLAHIQKLLADADKQAEQIRRLESERDELDHRQQLLDVELVRAEAQIELIKDVVLREKAF